MNIITPYAKILHEDSAGNAQEFTGAHGERLLRIIERRGRISHRSEDSATMDSWRRFIEAVVMGHGDWSITEHASLSVLFYVDRGITHEIVRHRLFSFTQESTRFVNYDKKMPPFFVRPPGLSDQTWDGSSTEWRESTQDVWKKAIDSSENAYRQLIHRGIAPQIARSVFPNALASQLVCTGNLRNWRHFFLMRTSKETHPQCREVTIPLLAEFQDKIPLLFADIQPNARQVDNLKLPR